MLSQSHEMFALLADVSQAPPPHLRRLISTSEKPLLSSSNRHGSSSIPGLCEAAGSSWAVFEGSCESKDSCDQ